ncbi:BCCT family transporter [Flavobacteriaceae bacterium F89]|uniref:BCCT family transporter n=1 Tax=Cerina litoralis TaxID=2874477 RepID=A0AAE3JNW4_9FLAO|nr:BCCT family transporter [Cerina litoralis]MCG2461490.1 BCCT family transporter [Cerina litoralis]
MAKKRNRSDETTFLGVKSNPFVFIPSLIIVIVLISITLFVGKPMSIWFAAIQKTVSHTVGWFYILLLNLLLFFALFLGYGKFGRVRIGGKNAIPEFSLKAWFAMLFSAGMGIGILFWSVAEPISHFNDNPLLRDTSTVVDRAKSAMGLTFLHWGIHVWALYAVVALALAYFTFNRKLPLTIRSLFQPLLGKAIYGKWGDTIDIISVVATLFGLATSLGLGVQQVNAGLGYLFGVENSVFVQILLIIAITAAATMSLVFGLDKGIKLVSEWNMRFAIIMLVFMLLVGPTIFLLKAFIQNIGHYTTVFFEQSMWTEAYQSVINKKSWQSSWTIFYWGWWISWSPFVGIFIARISKGRTFREFILGVLLVPTLFTFLWMTVFGGSALYQELLGNHAISEAVNNNVSTSIYYLLEQYPFASISSGLAIILVIGFFITSSDSGSFVVDTLTSGGRHDAPKGQKIFWASMEGAIAGVLLIGGGLVALQTAALLIAIPFAVLLLLICYSFYKALSEDFEN